MYELFLVCFVMHVLLFYIQLSTHFKLNKISNMYDLVLVCFVMYVAPILYPTLSSAAIVCLGRMISHFLFVLFGYLIQFLHGILIACNLS